MTVDNASIIDMNTTEGVDFMSDNMVAPEGIMSGGMMANMTDAPPPPSKLGEMTPVDFKTVEGAASTFARVLNSGGMAGARAWSERCHTDVEVTPTWDGADRCAAFDLAARYVDAGYSQAAGTSPIGYFRFQADNQADRYVRVGALSFAIGDRISRIQRAVEPATIEAVSVSFAKQDSRRQASQRNTENVVRPSDRRGDRPPLGNDVDQEHD